MLDSVVRNGSLLLNEEFSPVWILLLQSVFGPFELEILSKVLYATVTSQKWVLLSGFASLLLFDISHVGPSEHTNATDNKDEPSFRLVVETIWLIPVWEFSDILVSVWCFIAWLHITRNAKFVKF